MRDNKAKNKDKEEKKLVKRDSGSHPEGFVHI